MIEINYNNITKMPKEEKLIKQVVKKVLEAEEIKHDVDVYITLTNNEEIHKINKEYRDVDRPTDVLSFPMYEREEIPGLKEDKQSDEEEILGDIIVSVEKVKEQAEEYGHSFERELAYLVTHGMLHILGYDHMIEEEKKVMRAREEAILSDMGILRD
ncbi:MAG: rRNA maturation RNase YbeY [Clostridia bacterium]|nr:rRNA maturation RNase YbeY [Clostridia bacterium]